MFAQKILDDGLEAPFSEEAITEGKVGLERATIISQFGYGSIISKGKKLYFAWAKGIADEQKNLCRTAKSDEDIPNLNGKIVEFQGGPSSQSSELVHQTGQTLAQITRHDGGSGIPVASDTQELLRLAA